MGAVHAESSQCEKKMMIWEKQRFLSTRSAGGTKAFIRVQCQQKSEQVPTVDAAELAARSPTVRRFPTQLQCYYYSFPTLRRSFLAVETSRSIRAFTCSDRARGEF